jgi:L-iditol 2-dehydrogenase
MDKHADKLNVARKLGADHVGTLQEKELQNNFIGFDYVFECTGIPDVWEASVRYLRRGGTVILFGGCKFGTTVTYDTARLHYDEITLRGTFHYTPADVKKAYGLLSKENIKMSPLISGRFPLKHTQKVFEMLSKGRGIKYAIIP